MERAFKLLMYIALGCIAVAVAGAALDPMVQSVIGTKSGAVTAIVAVVIAIALGVYFLPTLIGRARGVTGYGWLLAANLLLGWSVIVWFGCLIWAAFGQTKAQRAFYERAIR